MIDADFCEQLEYALTRAWQQSDDPDVSGFWCDGVLSGGDSLSRHDELICTAFAGKDGQERFELILKLGPEAQRLQARGLSLATSIPSTEVDDWIRVDTLRKAIRVSLL